MNDTPTILANRNQLLDARTLALLNVAAGILGIVATMIPILLSEPLPPVTFWLAIVLSLGLCVAFVLIVLMHHRSLLWTHLLLLGGASCVSALFWLKPDLFGNVFIFLFMLGGIAAMLLPLPQTFLWGGCLYLATLLNSWMAFGIGGLYGWFGAIGAYIFFGFFGYVLQQADANFQHKVELYDELQATHNQLQRYAQQEQQLAVAEERNRLAREMHDSLGHQLTVVMMQMEVAQRIALRDPERSIDLMGTMRQQLKDAMNELRNLLHTMRTPETENAPVHAIQSKELPLVEQLEQLVNTFTLATGLPIELDASQSVPSLSPSVEHALYRTAQEGLTNVHRHASAQQAWVNLEWTNGHVTVRIEDNGVGFNEAEKDGSFGLIGLRERAAEVSGELVISARTGGGTIIRFDVAAPQGVHA